MSRAVKQSTRDEYVRRILCAQEMVAQNLDEVPKPKDVAKHAGFSTHHFHRIFKGIVGESLMVFVRRLRLERAARQLRSSERSITEIAFDAQYNSHEAFTSAFTSLIGVSPKAFRERDSNFYKREPAPIIDDLSVEIRSEPEREVVFMQHIGRYLDVAPVWESLMGWVMSNGVVSEPTQKMYGIVPDDPEITPVEKLRYLACIERHKSTPLPEGPVGQTRLLGGRYAIATHVGSYDTLHDTYLRLIGHWFPQSEYVPAHTPIVEHYLNSPSDTEAHELKTEVRVLIDEKGFS